MESPHTSKWSATASPAPFYVQQAQPVFAGSDSALPVTALRGACGSRGCTAGAQEAIDTDELKVGKSDRSNRDVM